MGLDIIAYQDLGGRCLHGETTAEDYERIRQAGEAFALLAEVHREAGVGLWANCETFTRSFPLTWRPDSPPGDIERVKYQLEVCSPPVDKVISWIYQGVWNKQTDLVNIGPPQAQEHYEAYLRYKEARRRS